MSTRNYWQRMRRKQMSRRALLRASGRAGVGAAGLALVGCGDDDDDAQPQTAAQAAQQQQQQASQPAQQQAGQSQVQEQAADQQADQAEQQEQTVADQQDQQQQQAVATSPITRGGTFRRSTPAATHDYFDPHRAVFGPTQYWMGFYMNYLVRWQNKEQGVMESDIASLPEIPDNETYIFRLDRGARYWDRYPTEGARAVTSEDIRLNFQRQIDGTDATGSADGTFLGADAFRKTASMDTPDDGTFIAKTDGPDATYLGGTILRPFSWITSPEAMEDFGDRWRDEAGNVDLSSGTGAFIPLSYDPDVGISMTRNDDYWKPGSDGGMLPYPDAVEMTNLTDPTAVEAAYRGKQIDFGAFPLSSLQVESISNDFPDHPSAEVAFGFTIVTTAANFNVDWPGSDGLGNPWVDRRFTHALHVAVDRYLMIDTVYLGSAKISANSAAPWFNTAWKIPDDELLSYPGFRPDRDADIADARMYLDASGYDKSRPLSLFTPDIWEGTYPGIVETMKTMYESALDLEVNFEIVPYTVILQRIVEGTYPGSGPAWTNPPADLDPTGGWAQGLLPGASSNLLKYDYPPVTEIVEQMQTTLDQEERVEMALKVQRIGMGVDPDHGVEGVFNTFGVMNGISPEIWWPYLNRVDDSIQFAHASHRHDETWLDSTHPDYPA